MKKRYQHYGREGIVWTKWFETNTSNKEPYQLKPKQLNEYKD